MWTKHRGAGWAAALILTACLPAAIIAGRAVNVGLQTPFKAPPLVVELLYVASGYSTGPSIY